MLLRQVAGVPGGRMLQPIPDSYCTHWWTAFFVDEAALTASRDEIVAALQHEGLTPAGSYEKYDLIGTRLFQQRVARPWLNDRRRMYPFVQPDGREYTYSLEDTPTHRAILRCGIMFGLSTWYTDQDVAETAAGVRKVFEAYAR